MSHFAIPTNDQVLKKHNHLGISVPLDHTWNILWTCGFDTGLLSIYNHGFQQRSQFLCLLKIKKTHHFLRTTCLALHIHRIKACDVVNKTVYVYWISWVEQQSASLLILPTALASYFQKEVGALNFFFCYRNTETFFPIALAAARMRERTATIKVKLNTARLDIMDIVYF